MGAISSLLTTAVTRIMGPLLVATFYTYTRRTRRLASPSRPTCPLAQEPQSHSSHRAGGGICSITSSQAGNGNFNRAASVTQTFVVVAPPSWTMVATPNLASFTAAGQAIGYNYTLTNTGNVTINSISVTGDEDRHHQLLGQHAGGRGQHHLLQQLYDRCCRSRDQYPRQRHGHWHTNSRHARQCRRQLKHHLRCSA